MEVTRVVIKNVLETGNRIVTVFVHLCVLVHVCVHVCASMCGYVYACIFVCVPCNVCIMGKICLSTKHYLRFQKTQKYKKTAHKLIMHTYTCTTLNPLQTLPHTVHRGTPRDHSRSAVLLGEFPNSTAVHTATS